MLMQIKFLKDMKKGKVVTKNHSRGVAFVEFTEHQHALVALRVLNNNPGKVFFMPCLVPKKLLRKKKSRGKRK